MITGGYCGLTYPEEYDVFLVLVNFLIPIVFICAMNVVLFNIAHRHTKEQVSKRVQGTQYSMKKDSLNNNEYLNSCKLGKTSKVTSKSFLILKNMKSAKRIMLLVGVLLVCWLSYIIIVVSNFVCNCNPRELIWIGNVINYSATAINPVLYGLLNKTIRVQVWDKMRRSLRHNFPSLFKYKFMRGPSLFHVRYRKKGAGRIHSTRGLSNTSTV